MSERILIISPFLPFPANEGNKIRISNFINLFYDNNFEVDFLLINKSDGDLCKLKKDLRIKDVYHYKCKKKNHYHRLLPLMFKLAKKGILQPSKIFNYDLDYYVEKELIHYFEDIMKKCEYCCVISEYLLYSKLLTFVPNNIYKIIDTHDKFVDRWKIFYDINQKPLWYSLSKENEKKGLERSDLIIAIQEEEQLYFESITENKVTTIPFYIENNPLISNVIRKKILFVGSSNPFNIASINYFLDEVFDLLIQQEKDIKLLIAGSICEKIKSTHSNIILLGRFDNPEDVYCQADIVINPMLTGTGLKIKSIEALSYSKFLVTSKVAATGLNKWENKAFVLAETPTDYVAIILNILGDKKYRENLQKGLQSFLVDWKNLYIKNSKEMLNLIKAID